MLFWFVFVTVVMEQASNENSHVSMDLHQDNVYWPVPPAKLFFYYEQPAAKGTVA